MVIPAGMLTVSDGQRCLPEVEGGSPGWYADGIRRAEVSPSGGRWLWVK